MKNLTWGSGSYHPHMEARAEIPLNECPYLGCSDTVQGRHDEFEPGNVQYSTPKFFDWLFLIRAY